jgi:Xaa-Pro aminopeptidase
MTRARSSAPAARRTRKAAPTAPARPNPTPDALVAFMMRDWEKRSLRVEPVDGAKNFAKRRTTLSRHFPGETLVIPTGHEKVRANDTMYRFRPGTDFFYLTGNTEPDCALVLEPKPGGGYRHVLYVEPNPGRSDKTFFTDHHKGELWVGPRLGVPESKKRFGVHECRAIADLRGHLESLSKKRGAKVRVLRGMSALVDEAVAKKGDGQGDTELARVLSELRLRKDEHEILSLERSIDSTKRAFEDVIRAMRDAKTERTIEGVFNLRAREEGNDVGYGTIAACGSNACVLHWTRNDGAMSKRELLLVDAGVEGHDLYTADITRTLPVGGKFSKEQRVIYDLVQAAQHAAFAEVKPGNDFLAPHRAAQRVLADGLVKLGLLEDADFALRDDQQLQKRYTLHGTSHMLGLDVHDCAKARNEVYRYGKLEEGMVLTIEPGLYFQPDDRTVPTKYRGIGVRIEDDVLVTKTGMRNLSASIPRTSDEVEAWIARVWAKNSPKTAGGAKPAEKASTKGATQAPTNGAAKSAKRGTR